MTEHQHPTHLYPEYGARVHINAGVLGKLAEHGTIVRDPRTPRGPIIVHLDDMTDPWDRLIFQPSEYIVTMVPSVNAQELLTRWSADELLEAMEKLADIDAGPNELSMYQTALIFEIYRITMYGERLLDADKYSHDEDWGADAKYDDGGWISGPCADQGERTRYGYDH